MKHYTFYDRDFFRNCGAFSISGKHYRVLLSKCFEYGTYFSLTVYDETLDMIKELDRWRIAPLPSICNNVEQQPQCRLYFTNSDVYGILIKYTDNIFECRRLPNQTPFEDFIFLRQDGSVFFDSIFHEGECSLYPRDEEDISCVLEFGHWLPINEDGIPEILAKECKLPYSPYNKIISDSLYISLREIQQSISHSIHANTIEELEHYINNYRLPNYPKVPIAISSFASFLPQWYLEFKFYVLGKCNAYTTTKITDALAQVGYYKEAAFERFFALLDEYIMRDTGHGDGCAVSSGETDNPET